MTHQSRIDKHLWWDRAWSLVGGCRGESAGGESAQQPGGEQ